jgi:hypothetical protein
MPATAMPPKRVRFNLTPTPPAAADPGTVFAGTPARFLARLGEASSSRYPQGSCGPPAWKRDYTFFTGSRDKEARGSSVSAPRKGCLRPTSHHDFRARICKRLWSPEIDSEESIQLAYVAWRAGTTNKVVVPAARLEIDSWLLKRSTNTGSVHDPAVHKVQTRTVSS